MKTRAPAKINWTLEVLGRREDGYHEIRSVMQTIDLCDELTVEKSDEWIFETVDGKQLASDDLIVRAARALEGRVGRELPTTIRVEKRIPVASGLGGGSSDAAAVLRLLNGLYDLGLSQTELAEVGQGIGSDVPFFVYGGTALVEGRGERVTPLSGVDEHYLALVVPEISMAEKTSRMYAGLTPSDYSDGVPTDRLVRSLSNEPVINEGDLFNVFDRHVLDLTEELRELGDGLFLEALSPVHAAGSGPAIFVNCGSNPGSESQAESLVAIAEALTVGAADTFVVPTLDRLPETSISDIESGSPL